MKHITINGCSIKNAQGFSLIEALIAMAVLSIGLLGIGTLQLRAVQNNKTGNTFSQAVSLARSKMEVLKSGDITDAGDSLNPAVFPTTTSDPNNPLDENGGAGGIYNLSWTVNAYQEDTDGDGIADANSDYARIVTVTVTFPFVGDGIRQVSLTSVVTGGGL